MTMTVERHTVASKYAGAGAEAVCVSANAGGRLGSEVWNVCDINPIFVGRFCYAWNQGPRIYLEQVVD